ncbi:MAG: lipid-A-disaccharide synthase [Bacteroidaceae bacterium]|nr:lipid-A-disaccharide synthase [Bacteroidaceae bacterium]
MKYFLIAGEASGDLHAGHLISALRAQDERAEFRFFGGEQMARAAGCAPLRHYRTLAYMGIVQVVLHLPTILRGMRECKEAISEWRPDCIILVDYPGFNLDIAKFVHREGICPVYYYIAPKIWAWKEYRIKRIKRDVDHLFSILPFEVDFFEDKHHYPITYVGNPTMDEVVGLGVDMRVTPEERDVTLTERVIALLPGSRTAEVRDNLAIMLQAAASYRDQGYRIVVSQAPSQPASLYESIMQAVGEEAELCPRPFLEWEERDRLTAALVTSGTASLEVALLGIPQVVCYKMSGGRLVNWLRPHVLKVPYISLPNLICQRAVVPELIAADMTPASLSAHLRDLLPGGPARLQQLRDYHALRQRLGEPGAPKHCAAAILQRSRNSHF